MCLDCGCLKPVDQHDDPRHITMARLQQAAQANDRSPLDTAQQILTTVKVAISRPKDATKAFADTANRPTVGFDIDNTMAQAAQSLLTVLNVSDGGKRQMADCTTPEEHDLWPSLGPIMDKAHDEPGFYINLGVYYEVRELAQAVARAGFHIIIASKRSKDLMDVSKQWLKDNDFPEFDDIIHGSQSKFKAAAKYGHNLVFIDDDPRNRYPFANKVGTSYIMPLRPWNAKLQGKPGYNVVADLDPIYAMLGLDPTQAAA